MIALLVFLVTAPSAFCLGWSVRASRCERKDTPCH